MTLMPRLVDTLRPTSRATRPAVLRIGVNGFSAVHNAIRRPILRDLHRQPKNRFHPVGVCRILDKPLEPEVADGLFDAAQITNALVVLGLAHKITGPANALLQLWTITYRNSFGMILHNDNMLVLQQAATCLGPSADALSVDSWRKYQTLVPNKKSRDYGGIATAANIAAVVVYFISGVAKVRSDYGWSWASGTALREQIAADALRKEVFGTTPPEHAETLYQAKGPIGVLATGALAVELLAPVALLDRKIGAAFALAAASMHWGIRFVMGIKFNFNLSGLSYLGFLPIGVAR
ncbi:hypothetical protein QP027_01295 [Corynebacterium breve]|uniref:HTTM domain-containing protein n=1 Tax=Corynebacterium breve TaxID=3049799 RepID=A0ABY8VG35_9CORY|nr:hypothetical protein [Corynebacterium breve]WIM68062.1 hypothetical protein QP027_01295 [Corynebacterium breve]